MTKLTIFLLVSICFISLSTVSPAQNIEVDSSRFSAYFWHSKDLFDNLPDIEGEIIFLGNSITDGAEWFELLGNPLCLNRGISGDVTEGVLLRLDAITKCKPAKVFIMIGVNDLAVGHSNDYIISNYKKIIAIIAEESPATEIYLQSILPVNPASGMFTKHTDKSNRILEINSVLEKLAENSKLHYIDINSRLADKNGFLKAEYSLDGLHLRYAAYQVWTKTIAKYLNN